MACNTYIAIQGMRTSDCYTCGESPERHISKRQTCDVSGTELPAQDKLKDLEQDRSKVYGDPKISHTAIGYAWRGILQNRFHNLNIPELTPDLVAEMLAAFKIVRLARPVYHQDSADDAHVYIKFSERFRQQEKSTPEEPLNEAFVQEGLISKDNPRCFQCATVMTSPFLKCACCGRSVHECCIERHYKFNHA